MLSVRGFSETSNKTDGSRQLRSALLHTLEGTFLSNETMDQNCVEASLSNVKNKALDAVPSGVHLLNEMPDQEKLICFYPELNSSKSLLSTPFLVSPLNTELFLCTSNKPYSS